MTMWASSCLTVSNTTPTTIRSAALLSNWLPPTRATNGKIATIPRNKCSLLLHILRDVLLLPDDIGIEVGKDHHQSKVGEPVVPQGCIGKISARPQCSVRQPLDVTS